MQGGDSWKYVVIWEFEVRAGCEGEFENAYGSRGDWVCLFQNGSGFIGTELTRKLDDPRRYVTLDFWESKQAYEEFRRQHEAEYAAIDMRYERLTEREVELGQLERLSR
jgi:heme-degrading monooxygenase HmoA